jgi:hypothetical protein
MIGRALASRALRDTAEWISEEDMMASGSRQRNLTRRSEHPELPPLEPPGSGGGPTPEYPILTEELGVPPSLTNGGGNGGGTSWGSNGAAAGGSLGPTVNKALQQVLGWKIKSDDAPGFLGALTQSFQLKIVEGAVVSKWTPRSYVVQTDLSGGVTGAQASIYTMAKTLSDQLLPLIDGLYALDPASDSEDVDALKQLVRSQVTNLTNEFGYLGGPRVMRVQQYFQMLFGIHLKLTPQSGSVPASVKVAPKWPRPGSPLLEAFQDEGAPEGLFSGTDEDMVWPKDCYWTSPDTVLGSLGDLRDELGVSEIVKPTYVNTVTDEQNVTNFRIVVDYANSLLNGWINSVQFFAGRASQFLGTQLVIISRQLGVVSETVDELRFVFDSVFIGQAQRETLQLDFPKIDKAGIRDLAPIYLEDMLQWMQDFVGAEAQSVIQTGGKLGLGEDFIAMIRQLYHQAYGLYEVSRTSKKEAIGTARAQRSIHKLAAQLGDLYHMAKPVSVNYIAPRQN